MLKVGIVGLPNVGKSTLFKTLTKKQVDCANFPFCTIEPNVGVVEVPDVRLRALAEISKSEKIIPAAIEFVDIAGLVRGAHKGEGLGNKFLSNIREVDMILHVVRNFSDPNVVHVEGTVDPARDVETIEIELALADLSVVDKHFERLRSKAKSGMTKDLEAEIGLCQKLVDGLGKGKLASALQLTDEEKEIIKPLNFLTAKPILYVVNVDESAAARQDWVNPLGEGRAAAPISVKVESEIVDLPDDEQKIFLRELGLNESGLDKIIKKCYEMLGLITFLTSGVKESRAWTIKRGAKAPQAAGVIHTDFEKSFIRVEVIDYNDFVEFGEVGAKEKGKMRVEGKDYIMRDGDVVYFRVGS